MTNNDRWSAPQDTAHASVPTPDEDHTPAKDDGAHVALATEPKPRRPFTPARVGPSQHSNPCPYNDPCNYLG
jgi:hypothetical protein